MQGHHTFAWTTNHKTNFPQIAILGSALCTNVTMSSPFGCFASSALTTAWTDHRHHAMTRKHIDRMNMKRMCRTLAKPFAYDVARELWLRWSCSTERHTHTHTRCDTKPYWVHVNILDKFVIAAEASVWATGAVHVSTQTLSMLFHTKKNIMGSSDIEIFARSSDLLVAIVDHDRW